MEKKMEFKKSVQKLKRIFRELKAAPHLDGFEDVDDVFDQFNQKKGNEKLVMAVYDQPPYEGSATVFFYKDKKYWEASGSHCSCYGLENQWLPEEVVFEELDNRVRNGSFEGRDFLLKKLLAD